jgi:hypothetical protein
VEGLYYPTPITPEEAFQAIGRLRKEARDEIDRLVRFLDETDNHMELEDVDQDGEGEDAEPSLGSFDRMTDQDKAWRQYSLWAFPAVDAEQDDADAEPSLGSMGEQHLNQEVWAKGDRRDLEVDDGDSGIGDRDGLLEQVGTQDWQQGSMG